MSVVDFFARSAPVRPARAAADDRFGIAWIVAAILEEKRLLKDIVIAALLSLVFAVSSPFIAMVVIDRALVNRSMSTIIVLSCIFVVMIVLEMALVYMRGVVIEQLSARMDAKISLYVIDRLLKLPISYYESRPIGEILARVEGVQKIRTFFGNSVFASILDIVTIIGVLPALIVINPVLAGFVALCMVAIFSIVYGYRPKLWDSYRQVARLEHDKNAFLAETTYGMRIIKLLSLEAKRQTIWDEKLSKSVLQGYQRGLIAAQSRSVLVPFERFMYTGSIILGGIIVLLSPEGMQPGALIAFAMLAGRAAQPIMQVANLLPDLGEVRSAVNELASVVNQEPEAPAAAQRLRPRIQGQITFQGVGLTYPNAARSTLSDLSFEIGAGSYFGIVGRSGSGKTSISRLIQGVTTTYSGTILLDGADIKDIDLSYLRSNIGFVAQEDMIFKGTVAENIEYGCRGASLEDIRRAAKLAGAHDFIEQLSGGYDTPVAERGSNFSGGQRQRIAIARALISDPRILILDEATSALDSESEALVNKSLRQIASSRTVIAISHRLSMLRPCHQILMLDDGVVVDIGPHTDLLSRCAPYQRLWALQEDGLG